MMLTTLFFLKSEAKLPPADFAKYTEKRTGGLEIIVKTNCSETSERIAKKIELALHFGPSCAERAMLSEVCKANREKRPLYCALQAPAHQPDPEL